ncbi:hypothetical protein V9K67_20760 [Paraflavisolibacter sp. H34]|uniref:hypothetical protein n=1 Tax=Huijunlia imazamoxiresistens TaxID=3127457 RepID=UPI003018166C
MARLTICIFFLFGVTITRAQTVEEWTQQRKTQLRYLVAQNAALEVWSKTLAKGYALAGKGLSLVRDIKDGDFSLHRQYFTSLTEVSPAIRDYQKVQRVISMQKNIMGICRAKLKEAKGCGRLSGREIRFLEIAYAGVLDECAEMISQLAALLTDGVLKMKDNERLCRIDALYSGMSEALKAAKSMGENSSLMANDREKKEKEIEALRALYGLKP